VSERLAGLGIGSLVVVEGDGPAAPVGIVTESDIVRIVGEGGDPDAVTVKEFMQSPVISVEPSVSVHEAADRMREDGIRRLPVIDDRLEGIVTVSDLTNYIPRLHSRIVEREQ
jgi:CBS domain-containing protein